MTWSPDDADTVQCVNELCQSLPGCPLCGSWTDLYKVTVPLLGGSSLVSFVLLCGSIRADRARYRQPACAFTLPMSHLDRDGNLKT